MLEQGHPDVSAVGPAGAGPTQAGSRELPVSSSVAGAGGDADGTVGGQAVLLDEPGMANVSHLYVDVVGEGLAPSAAALLGVDMRLLWNKPGLGRCLLAAAGRVSVVLRGRWRRGRGDAGWRQADSLFLGRAECMVCPELIAGRPYKRAG